MEISLGNDVKSLIWSNLDRTRQCVTVEESKDYSVQSIKSGFYQKNLYCYGWCFRCFHWSASNVFLNLLIWWIFLQSLQSSFWLSSILELNSSVILWWIISISLLLVWYNHGKHFYFGDELGCVCSKIEMVLLGWGALTPSYRCCCCTWFLVLKFSMLCFPL